MRTTLTIEDRIARDLKQIAHRSGKPLKVVVNQTLRAGLAASQERAKAKRYRLRTASLGGVRPGVDLDKSLALADTLEDDQLARKMEPAHWAFFRALIATSGTAGNLTSDAHFAALALEGGWTLVSTDHDFRRFSGLNVLNPALD